MNHNLRRSIYKNSLQTLVYLCTALTIGTLLMLIGYIFYRGLPHLTWDLISTAPVYSQNHICILPNILNTLYIIALTVLIALPVGVGAAVYLTEYAKNRRFIAIVEFTTETLAGIPSIIYGLVGMLFFVRQLGFKVSLLSGALTMAIVILPTVVRTTQESLKTVPLSYREGSLGLGATKWHMIRTIILPSSIDGIVTGCILSVGRIVGESAALLFTAGMGTAIINWTVGSSLFTTDMFTALGTDLTSIYQSGGGTLSVALYMYASERAEFDVAFAIAAVLLILVFCINGATKLVQAKLKQKNAR